MVLGDALIIMERWLVFYLPLSQGYGRLWQCWYDEIAAMAIFLTHLELFLPLLESGKWIYKLASVTSSQKKGLISVYSGLLNNAKGQQKFKDSFLDFYFRF
jgi:hypothetical protein